MSEDSSKKGMKNKELRIKGENAHNSKFIIHNSAGKAGFGSPARVILSIAAIFVVSQVLAAFIVGFIAAIGHPGHHVTDIFNNSITAQFFYVVIAEGLAVWLVYWLLKRRKISRSTIGLGRLPVWKDLRWAVTGAAMFYGLVIAGSIILSLFVSQNTLQKQQDVGFNNIVTNTDWVLAFISLVILPPIAEEILMRGYLYSGLRQFWKFWPALIITSILFGLAHLDGGAGGSAVWAATFDTFILSMVLVYIRDRSNALYAGMLIHATNNAIAFTVHFK